MGENTLGDSANVRQCLRELHDTYVWQVNAAIEEGREDLVARLADRYVDEALDLLISAEAGRS